MRSKLIALLAVAVLGTAVPASACDLCPALSPPLSWEMAQAPMVIFGGITSARLGTDGFNGTSDLRIEAVLKDHDKLKGQTSITIPRYLPPDPKVKFLLFVDVAKEQLDPYRGLPFPSDRIVKYLKEAKPLDPKAKPEDKAKRLLYFFDYLQDKEPEISADAFKEWGTASNLEVGLAADKLDAQRLRGWLADDKNTPANRLSLYAFLLGACGNEQDAEFLKQRILTPTERSGGAIDGFLAGYIRLMPKDGWRLTLEVLKDDKRPFPQRLTVMRMLRFYYGYQPEQAKDWVLLCCKEMLNQPDIADIAIDQLRGWKLWDLTDQVLALWKDAKAPITKRVLVRYALLCPLNQAKEFVNKVRIEDPKLVEDVEEGLRAG